MQGVVPTIFLMFYSALCYIANITKISCSLEISCSCLMLLNTLYNTKVTAEEP